MPVKYFSTNKKVQKQLKRLPAKVHKRAIEVPAKLKGNPLLGEKLHGELAEYFKYRLGDYRIVYRFDAKSSTLLVVKIEHRQGAYK